MFCPYSYVLQSHRGFPRDSEKLLGFFVHCTYQVQSLVSCLILRQIQAFLELVSCFTGNVNQNPGCQAVSQTGKTGVNSWGMQLSVRDMGVGSKGCRPSSR